MRDYSGAQSKSTNLAESIEKNQKKVSYQIFLLVLIVFLLGFFLVEQRIDYIRTENRVRKLLIKKRDLEAEILPLKLEEQYLTRLSKIENIAKHQLNLGDPRKRQVRKVVVSPAKPKKPEKE